MHTLNTRPETCLPHISVEAGKGGYLVRSQKVLSGYVFVIKRCTVPVHLRNLFTNGGRFEHSTGVQANIDMEKVSQWGISLDQPKTALRIRFRNQTIDCSRPDAKSIYGLILALKSSIRVQGDLRLHMGLSIRFDRQRVLRPPLRLATGYLEHVLAEIIGSSWP